jgi:hypothetical protein
LLQLGVLRPAATDQPGGTAANTTGCNGRLGCGIEIWVPQQPQGVVASQIQQGLISAAAQLTGLVQLERAQPPNSLWWLVTHKI